MRGAKKSVHNPCPVCGKPRGKGPYEFAHGKCAETRAKADGKKGSGYALPDGREFTVEQRERSRRNQSSKKYISGKLPDWMYS
jgi:hypothetical protein